MIIIENRIDITHHYNYGEMDILLWASQLTGLDGALGRVFLLFGIVDTGKTFGLLISSVVEGSDLDQGEGGGDLSLGCS